MGAAAGARGAIARQSPSRIRPEADPDAELGGRRPGGRARAIAVSFNRGSVFEKHRGARAKSRGAARFYTGTGERYPRFFCDLVKNLCFDLGLLDEQKIDDR